MNGATVENCYPAIYNSVVMPRIKLKELPSYHFSCNILVRTTDLNYGGHLANDRLLALIHEARVAYLGSFGFSELDCGGVSLILADTAVMYRAEAYAGDVLIVETAAGEPSRKGFRLFFRVTREGDGQQVALVENGIVTYDYTIKRPVQLPQAVKESLF